MFRWFKRSADLSVYETGISRELLIQSARVIFIDDETPLLIEHLRKSGFSVDHDKTGDEYESHIVGQCYDVAILDYSGVGSKFGEEQGLDLLKFIKRVSPRTRIISYTSKALRSGESDFYRLSDRVLAKDAGLRESLEYVEEQIQKAHSKQHLFDALMQKVEVASGKEKAKLKFELERALQKKDQSSFRIAIKKVVGSVADKGLDIVLSKMFIS
ncbi:hypothetical protein [Lysobacter sp. A03]|uniref:hypothetical protein n=1 Tax=Lysobacter sp. A03 TaxID=1199154 RepID=UPI0005C5F838|nr:hypothetical protein [Lysobacter sp. A03]